MYVSTLKWSKYQFSCAFRSWLFHWLAIMLFKMEGVTALKITVLQMKSCWVITVQSDWVTLSTCICDTVHCQLEIDVMTMSSFDRCATDAVLEEDYHQRIRVLEEVMIAVLHSCVQKFFPATFWHVTKEDWESSTGFANLLPAWSFMF